jgi:glyoxylase-like metal-dependent hydrolase (beta-lactamase superfamily II)
MKRIIAISFLSAFAALAVHASQASSATTTPALYTFETDGNGFNTRNFFLDTGREVVVFDAQFTAGYAQQSLEFIRSKTQNPIRYVVLTHPNPDKFNGASVFQALGAKVIASKATRDAIPGVHAYKKYFFTQVAKSFTDATYPKQATVDITFSGNYNLKLEGGASVQLRELAKPGVSSTQTIASIPSFKTVIVGDLVHYKAHAWLEGGLQNGKPVPTIDGWISDLEELKTLFAKQPNEIVYGGRGKEANLVIAVNEEIAYLKKADALVTEYVRALGARKSELSSDQAGEHYAAITKLLGQAFPEYAYSFMTQFSVYGLVNSKL